jgi:hypothetical protein
MLPGETWKVLFWETGSAKRRVALSGRIEAKKSCEQWSAAEAEAARARDEARFEERMSECGDQHDARWGWEWEEEDEWEWERKGCWLWFAGLARQGDGRCFERRDRSRRDWDRMAVTAARTATMSGYECVQAHARGQCYHSVTRPTRHLELLRTIVPREEVTLAFVGDDVVSSVGRGWRRLKGVQGVQSNGPDPWGQLPKTLAGQVHGPGTSLAPSAFAAETTTVFQALPVCKLSTGTALISCPCLGVM